MVAPCTSPPWLESEGVLVRHGSRSGGHLSGYGRQWGRQEEVHTMARINIDINHMQTYAEFVPAYSNP